jgi:Tfp pilus assembly protein PilO
MEDKLNELSLVNALIFGALFAASYYVLFYHPSNPEVVISGLDQSINAVKVEIAQMDKQIREGELLKKEIDEMEIQAEKIYKYIPENLSQDQASSSVSEEARVAGLSIQSIRAGQSWTDQETVSVGSVDVNVQGEFTQIMIFLSELTRKETIYSIKSVQIQDGVEADSGLKLTAQIEFYKRFQKSETGR